MGESIYIKTPQENEQIHRLELMCALRTRHWKCYIQKKSSGCTCPHKLSVCAQNVVPSLLQDSKTLLNSTIVNWAGNRQ